MKAWPPPQAVSPNEELNVEEGKLHVAGRQPRGLEVLVFKKFWLEVEGKKISDLCAALKGLAAVDTLLERQSLVVHDGKLMVRVAGVYLRTVDGKEGEMSGRTFRVTG